MKTAVTVLNSDQVNQKTERLAHQIYEHFHGEDELILVGIANKGYQFARNLHQHLSQISDKTITLASITLHKEHPFQKDCEFSIDADSMIGKTIVLVDDVLNSGKTLIYACKHILEHQPKKITTVVLVDRRHRKFPIRADYVGLTLSTTLEEHITVDFEENMAFIS